MATAQQLIVNGLIALINSNPNVNGLVLATSPSAGCLRLTTKTADAPSINYNAGASHVTGAGIFTARQDAGPPATADLYFSWTLIPGNTVAINIGSGARSLDLHYQLPAATVVDVGGFDYRSSLGSSVVVLPGGTPVVIPGGGTPAPHPAVQPSTRAVTPTDRRLVVMECGSASPEFGELFALAPTNATAVPIPAFRFGTAKPPVGSAVGEAFYETTSRKGWVWDGSAWREIAATPLKTYATEADLVADTGEVTGTYAIATDTGALFVKRTVGWAYIGIRDYTTTGALLADTQSTGALGLALDDDTMWQMTPTGWRALSIRHLADTTAVQAWANPAGTPAGTNPQGVALGDQAMDMAHEVMYVRTAAGWKPETIWEETEANIRAATWCLAGQEAIATDTGRTFVYTTAGWVEEPIQHYATEALLLAATAANGTLAWADDTNVVFTRAAGTWHRLQGPQISVGTTAPTAPGTGDLWYDSAANRLTLNIWNGTGWISTTGVTVGGTGAKVILPGYFNEDPSATATADDIGGLAFKYSGNTTQLFLNKGALWHPMTPVLGEPANEGKALVADSHGNATWSAGKLINTISASGSSVNSLTVDLSPLPKTVLRVSGVFAPKTDHCRPMIIAQHDGSWIDWSGDLVFEGMFLMQWDGGGGKNIGLKSISSQGGGYLISDNDPWKVGHHSPCPFHFDFLGFGLAGTNDYCHIAYRLGPYKNKDGSILTIDGLWRMGATFDPRKVNNVGFKFTDGSNTGPCSLTAEWL